MGSGPRGDAPGDGSDGSGDELDEGVTGERDAVRTGNEVLWSSEGGGLDERVVTEIPLGVGMVSTTELQTKICKIWIPSPAVP